MFSVYDEARGISDDLVLQKAFSKNWALIINDKNFGEKIYRDKRSHRGIVLMRLSDERSSNKIAVLAKPLNSHLEQLCPSHHSNIHSLNGVKGQSPFVGAQPPHPQKTNL